MNTTKTDVLIIGAGVSGLAAASQIEGSAKIVLEASDRVGGRVMTTDIDGMPFELGATIGYATEGLPEFLEPSPFVRADGAVGLLSKGAKAFHETPLESLRALLQERPDAELDRVVAAATTAEAKELRQAILDLSDPVSRQTVNDLFSSMHPGELEAYSPRVVLDAFHRFYPSYHEGGNGELTAQMVARCDVLINHRAESLTRQGDGWSVMVVGPDGPAEFRCERLVLATDANTAAALLSPIFPELSSALATVTYGPFSVVGFGFKEPKMPGVSYAYTPELRPSAVGQRIGKNGTPAHVGFLFSGAKAKWIQGVDEQTAREVCLEALSLVAGTTVHDSEITSSAIQHWPLGGTVLSNSLFLANWPSQAFAQAGLYLAGDYCAPMGYGIASAMKAGTAAAKAVNADLG
ncbi:flavin monoamine oxidase family protein [Shimia ponticola]|uniref:flavin monoamine oxidase family protein n=1 Tax=Shimia ponticola TaxID=2582893 RepID=UPI0011BD84A0|nr:FAD-dependent oxidoreductase [Shimia ponticola]